MFVVLEGLLVVFNINKILVFIFWKLSFFDGGFFIISYVIEIRESWKILFFFVEKVFVD